MLYALLIITAVSGGPDVDIPIPDLPGNVPVQQNLQILTLTEEVNLEGPQGSANFHRIGVDEGIRVQVAGPCTLMLWIHALRNPASPDTLKPLVIGLLLDDVLLRTMSIESPANKSYQLERSSVGVSPPTVVPIAIAQGTHTLAVTISDDASFGALVRPLQEAVGAVAPVIQVEAEDAAPARVESATGIGLLVGMLAPSSLPTVGLRGQAELDIGFSAGNNLLGVVLGGGVGYTKAVSNQEDPRDPSGSSTLQTTLLSIPIYVAFRWALAVTQGIELCVSAGGGVKLSMVSALSRGDTIKSGLKISGTAIIQAGGNVLLGPGAIVVRFQAMPSSTLNTGTIGNFSPTSGSLMAGYQLRF